MKAGTCSAADVPPLQSSIVSWLSRQYRGGSGAVESNRDEDPVDRKSLWNSIGALLELSADAKENAVLSVLVPQTTNGGRGGASAVVKPRNKLRFILSNLISPPKLLRLTSVGKTTHKVGVESMPALEKAEDSIASTSRVTQFWWSSIRESLYSALEMEAAEDDVTEIEVTTATAKEVHASERREATQPDDRSSTTVGSASKKKKKSIDKDVGESSIPIKELKERDVSGKERIVDVTKTAETTANTIVSANSTSRPSQRDAIVKSMITGDMHDVDQENQTHVALVEKERISDFVVDTQAEQDMGPAIVVGESPYTSSGLWGAVDTVFSIGLSTANPQLRLSRQARPIRKALAKATGLHGLVSGKPKSKVPTIQSEPEMEILDEEDLGIIRRRIAAIERARKSVELKQEEDAATEQEGRGLFGRRRKADGLMPLVPESEVEKDQKPVENIGIRGKKESNDDATDRRAQERVMEIDKLIAQGQQKLQELACEKDALQLRPNPLYNYSTTREGSEDEVKFSRTFSFPSDTLVEDYLDDLFAHGRLIKMNHTHLWKSGVGFDDDEDESIGDDLLTPSADASRLYSEYQRRIDPLDRRNGNGNGGGGSWILRQSLGKGGSLGEKIGEAAEIAGYKAVCASVMSSLARVISAIHGMNLMAHSDIRLFMEQVPDLPPISKTALPRNDYAEEAIKGAILKSRKRKKKDDVPKLSEETFIQRDAIVETLLSHCQISAPLLKLFPLAWQRALLANMITLITHVISDFAEGIELQILGHALTFSFKPITESDMIRHIGLADKGMNHRRAKPEEFEAAVRATAEDLSQALKILDRWHERALGSGMLRAQIANLIARLVLTLADEVLSGARMDLWAAQAGGPRVLLGLEYRASPAPLQENDFQ